MLTLPPSVRIFIACAPTDMRRSHNGLMLAVRQTLAQDPFSGHLYVFFNKNKDQVKDLFWDRSGFSVLAKRFEKGQFSLPTAEAEAMHVDIEAADLALILEGINLHHALATA